MLCHMLARPAPNVGLTHEAYDGGGEHGAGEVRASSCGVTCAFLARYTHHTPSVSLHTTQAKSLEEFTFILPITKSHARRAGSTHGLSSCNCMLTVCRIEDALRRTIRLIHALRERSPSLATWTQAWAATRRRVSRHTIQREELHRKNGTPFKAKTEQKAILGFVQRSRVHGSIPHVARLRQQPS